MSYVLLQFGPDPMDWSELSHHFLELHLSQQNDQQFFTMVKSSNSTFSDSSILKVFTICWGWYDFLLFTKYHELKFLLGLPS